MTKKNRRAIRLPRSISKLYPQVEKAYDADKAIEVSVSKKDCADAQRLNPTECALAQAAKRELHAEGVVIGMASSYIIKGKTAYRYQTPGSVAREIVSFDRHQDFAPGDYYLLPKAPSAKFGETHRGNRTNPNKKVRRKVHTSARVRVLDKGTSY